VKPTGWNDPGCRLFYGAAMRWPEAKHWLRLFVVSLLSGCAGGV